MNRLDKPECYFNELPAMLQPKRDLLAQQLQEVGMLPVIPDGGYFMIADFSKLGKLYTLFILRLHISNFVHYVISLCVTPLNIGFLTPRLLFSQGFQQKKFEWESMSYV